MTKQEWIRDLILEVQEWKNKAGEWMSRYSDLLNAQHEKEQEAYDRGFREGQESAPAVNRTFIMGGSDE